MNLNKIPESHADLLMDETKAYAYLATTMKDGSPQVTPVWFNTDGDYILINTAEGRVKDQNMRARPQIALAIQDPEDHFRYIQVRGRVATFTHERARQHINILAGKYTGKAEFSLKDPNEIRVIYKLLPERVQVMG